ncbi:MAG TPA: hypothetical protein VFQ53_29890 [Kofleriaceae bacterium]|nr:hypothetical protein [Kofleriaceae bacterium]
MLAPDVFYLHEDEWGMIALEPVEALAERQQVVDEARTHAEAHQAQPGSSIYVAPRSPVTIATRAITLAALRAALPDHRVVGSVHSEFLDYPGTSLVPFALGLDAVVLYGLVDGEHVAQLAITECKKPMGVMLHRLGMTFRLLLCDLWRNVVVDLADRLAVERYVSS